ncbi:hypothetical protein NA57DRAFT_58189 [Rhizodiscina lignyota]|uniref:Sacsin/Nov domain-containing protein n=1 Tax=Rhizodiscina lignyota TaxID=1504668 RepID=A0A9P4M7S8_9PEZI|nr:hypothetical protein NA57DRAFT_58189 [Rhizodiscina lignyota]
MARNLDLSRLRDQTMGSGEDEEAVTVNTRALVDKILARYSGEYTTIRELIQNAADAKAAKVTIRLETVPSSTVPVPQTTDQSALLKHTILHHTMNRMVISNNGEPFQPADWARLKRIAEGNPDETKIGAFGVGFYSVFADCEEPFVVSGRKTMAFYWKNNSLFTKSGQLSPEQTTSDTQFLLNYRNTEAAVPDLLSLCKFLTTSLTFVDLEAIELILDDWTILSLKKIRAPGVAVPLPSDIKTKTQEGMMKIVSVVHQSTQLEATWMNVVGWTQGSQWQVVPTKADKSSQAVGGLSGLFSKFTKAANNMSTSRALKEKEAATAKAVEEDLGGVSKATAFLRTSTVNVQTYVKPQFARDLERATKKPPPKHTRIEILTSSYDEASAFAATLSGAAQHKAGDLFESVLTSKSGRVFIGFPTKQTTGLLCHISAPSVIPTVEREAIDLNAESVRTWNQEMLRVAGIACRISYAGDMADLKKDLARKMTASGNKTPSKEDLDAIVPAATHIFQQFTAQDTTPEARVGKIIQDAFWSCGSASMEILSTKGILPCLNVRILKEKLTFLDSIPSIPEKITQDANEFIYKLYTLGYLQELTVRDMQKELESRALDESQLSEFLKWAGKGLQSDELDAEVVHRLFGSAVVNLGSQSESEKASKSGSKSRILTLDQIETFQGLNKIPAHMPVPPTTMPFRLVSNIPRQHLESFGWTDLNVVPWLRFIVSNASPTSKPEETGVPNMCFDSDFASQVLVVLSKQWDTLSQSSKGTVVEMLSSMPVIPTKRGLKRPSEAYFTSVKIFDDLPTVTALQGTKEKFLVALGVRKTIEINVVFDRLLAKSSPTEEAKWSFADLIKYFVSVRDDIPKADLEKLKTAPICPVDEQSEGDNAKPRLVPVTELYQPEPDLKYLRLPLLKWEGLWRENSQEARFLKSIGLKPYPSVAELAVMMQKAGMAKDSRQYTVVLSYFVHKHHQNGYARAGTAHFANTPFLKMEGVAFPNMASPVNVYANPRSAVLGFSLLEASLRPHADKFGVVQDPELRLCAQRVINQPPRSRKAGEEVFGYLATRLPQIDETLVRQFSEAAIVPITMRTDEKGLAYRWMTPKTCFLGESETYGEIFDYVTFGDEGNLFLLRVGSKSEPNSLELAKMLVDSPAKILGILKEKKYLDLLRKLSENLQTLKADNELWRSMRSKPFLLAYRTVNESANNQKHLLDGSDDDDDDDKSVLEVLLQTAGRVVISDSIREYQHFREQLCIAPPDDALEAFYASLGVPLLSSLIVAEPRIGNPIRDNAGADKWTKQILERVRLFLFDYNKDNIHHDARWIEKSVTVVMVDSVSTRISLKGYQAAYSEKRTAFMAKEPSRSYKLYLTSKPNLYDVSGQLVPYLLKRPKKTDVMALEMIFFSDLRGLREKGYNVNRILKQKETEARLAEEYRQKQHEEERRQREQETSSVRDQTKRALEATTNGESPPPPYDDGAIPSTPSDRVKKSKAAAMPNMPGAFGSPEADTPESLKAIAKQQKSQSFLSRIGNQLGNQLGYNPNTNGSTIKAPQPQGVTNTGDINRNLASAIQACRSHDSNTVFSQPTTKQVQEANNGSYCDTTPGQNIAFFTNTSSGVKVYLANHILEMGGANSFATNELPGLERFAALLRDLVSVFELSPSSVHIFFDDDSRCIAFNMSGALFCNYQYFKQLHLPTIGMGGEQAVEALSYWWITLCHELAHNIERTHGPGHSFYTESFASTYFTRLMGKAAQY